MDQTWQDFIAARGARFEQGYTTDFGDPAAEAQAAEEKNVVADLSCYGLLRVQGDDARTFLQNQFTNDMRQVSPEYSHLNGYCTPKGRLLATFRVLETDDGFLLRLPLDRLATVRDRLSKYILMSKVNIEALHQQWGVLGLSGPDAPATVASLIGTAPEAVDQSAAGNQVVAVRIPSTAQPRFELYAPVDRLATIWDELEGAARPVGATAWALLDIRAGLPEVVAATEEAFVPQMVNLPQVGGVSFRKGCYPGQEVVARMQYLGKLKRRMYRARVEAPAAPGDALFSALSASGQGAGKVVTASPSADGATELLAVIEIAVAESGEPIRLGSLDGPAIALADLPYTVGAEAEEA